ncbi:MAG TPA: hypothetical protein IGS52_22305 [Oscillatoriaceae cyanobacterium M33_DOE_052]|uniref:DUF4435 domain-containing protein n=1 Tax=Planktothricoides sp. SpSt-374 TaxID=2282167 RepID=A0A7C3VGG4_9CYAN|nr:hypothetical protein [Oscillatoriaceae cyanobacterium M33_DOE_052]
MPKQSKPQQLLVEGKNDQHVIWGLCQQYQLPELFDVAVASEKSTEGIEALLSGLPAKLKEANLQTLGIVVDADDDLAARWQSLTDKLRESGYQDIPPIPPPEGWVYQPNDPYLPRVGVWIMPNNQLPGMLEDFVAALIPADDALKAKAEAILTEIEQEELNRYTLTHRPKVLIHTWLAWQKKPGMPMGQAITARVLDDGSEIAIAFVEWLKRLFNL